MVHKLVTKFKQEMGKNFMTPTQLKFKVRENTVIELSKGEGFDRKDIYGVTVRTLKNNKWKDVRNQSKMFYSKIEAENYFNTVR